MVFSIRSIFTIRCNSEKGLFKTERTQIQSRKLSDIMCDNMDIESIKRDVFQSKSKLMDCRARTKLNLNGPTQASSGISLYQRGNYRKQIGVGGLLHVA